MKVLEFLLVASLTVIVLAVFVEVRLRKRLIHLLPAICLLILGMHLLVEGYRWQMLPAYFLSGFLFITTFRNLHYFREPWMLWRAEDFRLLRVIGALFALLILLDTYFVLWVAPLFKMPEPDGTYPIGTKYFFLMDVQREETFTPQAGDLRSVSAQVWYPAAEVNGYSQQSYLEYAPLVSSTYARFLSMPSFAFSHLDQIKTHAYRDAPAVGEATFPVLIFSHAYNGNITQNTVLMEELASHGYVVFSIGHAYETPFIFDAAGKPVLFDPENVEYQKRLAEIDEPQSDPGKGLILEASQASAQAAYYRQLFAHNASLQETVHIWAEDTRFLIDQLETLNRNDPILAGRMDLTHIGVLGHSMGGAAAGQFCLVDARCKAGVNMDGFQYGDLLERDLQVPFMFMYSSLSDPLNSKVNEYFYERVKNFAYSLVIVGSIHESFSDLPLIFRGYRLQLTQSLITPKRCDQILNTYILAFFDRYLKGIETALLTGPSDAYPEVQLEFHPP